jgi:hypothetical protein
MLCRRSGHASDPLLLVSMPANQNWLAPPLFHRFPESVLAAAIETSDIALSLAAIMIAILSNRAQERKERRARKGAKAHA